MSDSAVNADRLFQLAGAVCNKSVSEDELIELYSLLATDQTSRYRYADYCRIHAALRMELRAHRVTQEVYQQIKLESAIPAPRESGVTEGETLSTIPFGFLSASVHNTIGFFSQELPFSLLIATLLTGFGLWIASLVYVSSPERIAKDSLLPTKTSFDPTLKVVGKITGMVDCKWANPNTETFHGANVLLGRKYALSSGLMEITYDSGARVILQGPATYEVELNGGYMAVGKLTGKLEKKLSAVSDQRSEKVASESGPKSRNPEISKSPISNPFVIHTPTAVVTDLGTEFGVEVAEDGVCGVQVFQGLVTVTAGPADQFAIGTPRKLCAGEAMRVHRTGIDGTVKVVNVAPNASWKFVRSLSVNPRTYRETVLADKPLFYWTFDEPTGPAFEQVRQLPELALYPKGSAGRYLHSSLSNGGLSLGRAANFSWAAGCFASNVLGQGKMPGAWAIEFWMQAVGDRNGYRRQYLLNVGGPPKDDLGKWNDPAIIFDWGDRGGTNNELQLVDNHGRTTGGPQIEDSRWHHVILVFFGNVRVSVGGPKAGGVLDGAFQAVDPGQIQSAFDLSQGLLVGTDTSSFSHGFCGRLDELAFYDLSNLTTTQIEARVKEMAQRHLATAQPKPAAR